MAVEHYKCIENYEPKKIGLSIFVTKKDVKQFRRNERDALSLRSARSRVISDAKKEIQKHILEAVSRYRRFSTMCEKRVTVHCVWRTESKCSMSVRRKAVIQQAAVHYCRECSFCEEVWKPTNLLSLKGEPTLGTCPHWKESRCLLLSQKACNMFKRKI